MYCKLLSNAIKEANNLFMITKLINQPTKLKQLGTLYKRETNRHKRLKNVTHNDNSPEAFNNYFLTVSENIIKTSNQMGKTMIQTTVLITMYRISHIETFLT